MKNVIFCQYIIVSMTVFFLSCERPVGIDNAHESVTPDFYRDAVHGSVNEGVNFASDSGSFDLMRGEEADFPVAFKNCMGFTPFILTTNAGNYMDFTTCVRDVKKTSFALLLSLSSNSSAPVENGIFVFDWVVFPWVPCLPDVDFGKSGFDYVLSRGGGKTTAVQFNKTFDTAPIVFVSSNSRAKDFVHSTSGITAEGFNYEFCMSGNSSKPSDSGSFSFSWMAVHPAFIIPGFEIGTNKMEYTLGRGQSTTTNIVFKNAFKNAPVVIISSQCILRDVYISTVDKTPTQVSVKISLSANSSLPNITGIFTFAWLAIASL